MAGTVRQLEHFLAATRGLAPLPPPPPTQTRRELDRFAHSLRQVRGLTSSTIRAHTRDVQHLLEAIGYEATPHTLTQLTPQALEGFLAHELTAELFHQWATT